MSDVSNFEKMVAEFKDLAELQNYCNAQYKTIIELTKKLNEQKQLEYVPTIATNTAGGAIIHFQNYGMAPEEEICMKQLHELNISSKARELTLEECKKVEIYTKVLASIRAKVKDVDAKSKHMTDDELLKLAGSGDAT